MSSCKTSWNLETPGFVFFNRHAQVRGQETVRDHYEYTYLSIDHNDVVAEFKLWQHPCQSTRITAWQQWLTTKIMCQPLTTSEGQLGAHIDLQLSQSHPKATLTQMAKALMSTSIRYGLDMDLSDRCRIDDRSLLSGLFRQTTRQHSLTGIGFGNGLRKHTIRKIPESNFPFPT